MPRDSSRSRSPRNRGGRRDSRQRGGGGMRGGRGGGGGGMRGGGGGNPNNINVNNQAQGGGIFGAFSGPGGAGNNMNQDKQGQNLRPMMQLAGQQGNNINAGGGTTMVVNNTMRGGAGDNRPDVERRKGGVKLFVGRIPQEAPEQLIRKVFERFGQVLEVFKMRGERPGEERHSLYHEDGLTCAFVRMRDVPSAEDAIARLHDQEILLKNRRDTGPIQVAYAKGEAIRLGLESTREILPNRLEGKEILRQLKERMIMEAPDQQSFKFKENGNPFWFPTDPLIEIVKNGRKRDRMFENCWRHYCSEGWGGTYEIDPELMPHHGIVQFVMMRTVDYGDAEWFLNLVKTTHNKLSNGEIQSNQRRNLSIDEIHSTDVKLERPGDPTRRPSEEDRFNVVARHAEIRRNRQALQQGQTIAPGQGGGGVPPPGQGAPPVPGAYGSFAPPENVQMSRASGGGPGSVPTSRQGSQVQHGGDLPAPVPVPGLGKGGAGASPRRESEIVAPEGGVDYEDI